ncbi:uridine permease-like protein Fui1 [Hortaea werneckii]|nr:uridine permease-like protein Fui1 [Hortaea werneckii]KAI6850428.1 uridine permease-like protein Fui1 [Hortaea werneckii]KAI6944583.1 uridine permease-like protein Fui1 [Hortaea werneckii]KAI6950200.1 uridine permease-like protein Fui1 [Hortaea werneckii]KAI6979361.1 uridine permease-like protein Fui1 [Hortaea werneckii]
MKSPPKVTSKAFDSAEPPPSPCDQQQPTIGEIHPYVPSTKSKLRRFKEWIRLDPKESPEYSAWSNADLEPVAPAERTWSSWNFITYWLCDAIAPGNLRLGSSLVTLGLSWRTAIGIIALGHFIAAVLITLNGIIGARLHIPYTIQSRAAYGFYFSFFVVFVRMLVGFFWYGINTYNGAICVHAVLVAIWPAFGRVENGLAESANISTQMMTAYVIYFLIVLPFHYIHPRKLRWFFSIKALLCIPAMVGMLIWACQEPGDVMKTSLYLRGSSLGGSAYSWAFLSGMNSMIGNYGTMAVNINDFARYANRTRSVFVQLIIVPLSFAVIAYIGVLIAGVASDAYGVEVWDPLDIMAYWTGSSGARAGAAFCGLSFTLAQLGANISANCISAANDLNAMFPKYINLRRGSYIIAFVGAWALTPWNILASASALLNFMDGYIIWLAPITGILLADYWVVHSQRYAVSEMYKPVGKYRYNRIGTNWRAVVAWCVGWIPLMPGFCNAVSSSTALDTGAEHLYNLSYLYGFLVSAGLYCVLSRIFPAKEAYVTDDDIVEFASEKDDHQTV